MYPVAVVGSVPGGEGDTAGPDFSKLWELNALDAKRVFSLEVASQNPQI
jgi:hypothetical protein